MQRTLCSGDMYVLGRGDLADGLDSFGTIICDGMWHAALHSHHTDLHHASCRLVLLFVEFERPAVRGSHPRGEPVIQRRMCDTSEQLQAAMPVIETIQYFVSTGR